MIMESLPGDHVTHTQLEQRQDLTKIVCDRTIECSHHGSTRCASRETGGEARSHQLQRLRNVGDQLCSTAAS